MFGSCCAWLLHSEILRVFLGGSDRACGQLILRLSLSFWKPLHKLPVKPGLIGTLLGNQHARELLRACMHPRSNHIVYKYICTRQIRSEWCLVNHIICFELFQHINQVCSDCLFKLFKEMHHNDGRVVNIGD